MEECCGDGFRSGAYLGGLPVGKIAKSCEWHRAPSPHADYMIKLTSRIYLVARIHIPWLMHPGWRLGLRTGPALKEGAQGGCISTGALVTCPLPMRVLPCALCIYSVSVASSSLRGSAPIE